jgi:hypothetical protein
MWFLTRQFFGKGKTLSLVQGGLIRNFLNATVLIFANLKLAETHHLIYMIDLYYHLSLWEITIIFMKYH